MFASLAFATALFPCRVFAEPPLDPARDISKPVLEAALHRPLPEQYLWVAASTDPAKDDRATARYFRAAFAISKVPRRAVLYVAGPNRARAVLNGKVVLDASADGKSRISPFVAAAEVASALRRGRNELIIEGSRFPSDFTQDFGAILPDFAAKIVPAAEGAEAPAIVETGRGWEASLDGRSWSPADLRGGLEGDGERFQFNADAGMYRWPGYDGISPYLARLPLTATAVVDAFEGLGRLSNVGSLTHPDRARPFAVELPRSESQDDLPELTLDFGREISGRLRVQSASAAPLVLEVQYGESKEEAEQGPFLGPQPLAVPPGQTIYAAKSAFRYARVKFLAGRGRLVFKSLGAEAIYYPVKYEGSFESSDELLNRVWAAGAHTAHLCMQDGIWDAPKRDRARWTGDLDVAGRVIEDVFGDEFLMKESLNRLVALAEGPRPRDVNTIPGYSAFWVTSLKQFYLRRGDKEYLLTLHDPLAKLLGYMQSELDRDSLFDNKRGGWLFVDWSPGLNDSSSDVSEALAATHYEFYAAFRDGAWLLARMGDGAAARKYAAVADALERAAQRHLLRRKTRTFGQTWQSNAMAVFSGLADPREGAAVWDVVLSTSPSQPISPYYSYYALSAMAELGHRRQALDWIRRWWGGMLALGLTTTPETYDESWPKDNFHHEMLVGDAGNFFPSLSHGWSSGPTAWLMEEVLGVKPLEPGYARASIRPDLAGLSWARGAVATPHGPIRVSCREQAGLRARVELPAGVLGLVSLPSTGRAAYALVNGRATAGVFAEGRSRLVVPLQGPGRFELSSR